LRTEFAKTIELSAGKSQYDEYCKRILANKFILAWILKGSIEEYNDISAHEIINYIENEPEISSVPVEPSMTNMPVIHGINTEDNVAGEGVIRYDIQFCSLLPQASGKVRVIINIEAQKDPYPGYSIITRGIFYAARMISSQLGTEFIIPHYDDLKKVFSIWICFNSPAKTGNAISSYGIIKRDSLGSINVDKKEYDKLEIIQIHLNQRDLNQTELTEMLNILFGNKPVEQKKDILSNRFDIPVESGLGKEIDHMCNVSDYILEQGLEKGRNQIIENMIRKGYSDEMIKDVCNISQERLDEIKDELFVNA
jgi:hypothetical protein